MNGRRAAARLAPERDRPRGGPLAILVLLLAAWASGRAMWWEDPFATAVGAPLAAAVDFARAGPPPPAPAPRIHAARGSGAAHLPAPPGDAALVLPLAALGWSGERRRAAGADLERRAAAHQLLWFAALGQLVPRRPSTGGGGDLAEPGLRPASAPFLPAPSAAPSAAAGAGRWSLDAWAFWRQGSDAAPISQGRVPIYGASQAGAVLHYRLAPGSRRDPWLYARAYRALVRRGESELALGAALRPLPRLPLRAAAELRYTDGAFGNDLRPAAYVVTEIPPLPLPHGTRLEAYGQAGWVGGPAPTPFADGQASVTRELTRVAGLTDNALRLSLGAGAWGGAQEDAQRIDIGPTLRVDLTVGAVPARLSVDWRERVGGKAGPDSGVAATLSTRF